METATQAAMRQLTHDEFEVTLDMDVDRDTFHDIVMPFAIGYMGRTHGLTNVSYVDKTLTFTRTADES